MISNFQGQCHVFLAHTIGAKRVLEIGVYVGYSSLVWAHAVGPEGKVTGLEFSDEYAKLARDAFEKYGVKNAEVIQGNALQTYEFLVWFTPIIFINLTDSLPELNPEEPYDLIFIDAQKSGYPEYLRQILAKSQPGSSSRILRKGGLIVGDNVLRRGLVADDSSDNPWSQGHQQRSEYETDRDLEYLREFNDLMHQSDRLEAFLMPLFDGFGLGRLLDWRPGTRCGQYSTATLWENSSG
jgi:predicted O-methyltransferase YrrM